MKQEELKLRVEKMINGLINTYFGENVLSDKLLNATLKAALKANIGKIDNLTNLFKDENGEINAEEVVNAYATEFGENGIRFDIRDYVGDDFLSGLLPDKYLLIKKDDFLNILK